ENQHISLGASQDEKILSLLIYRNIGKSFDAPNFSGAFENENIRGFPLRRDGWKDSGKKQSYISGCFAE
ncbi:hypothetical protein AFK68_09100, partial [Hydrocoleum sp. CS-953]|uniref:hypothetical protein n=1 Tax=Hydrocoleum sp. CS-953 TaxID=1671698 RepID=UPI000BDC5D61